MGITSSSSGRKAGGVAMETPKTTTIRCAIYTRKSTEEGLDQDFNSLDAQREAAEAFIASQRAEGWVCLPEHYDDGGFTGGNMDRPALKRLMADIEDGQIDCVIVYKVDRMSRSLLDFSRIMGALEERGVSFVSVTQQFNTTSSMGRLTLNILLSFAQFERELISERTRDKIAATRRKGKWSGGRPVLGFDVDPGGGRLLVNEDEAARVRAIFELYQEQGSLIATIREMDARGWTNKRWTTKAGREIGGRPYNKHSLHSLLTNVLYLGKVTYKGEIYEGEQPALVSEEAFQAVHQLLKRNGATGGREVRNRFGAVLKGLLNCAPCSAAMVPTHTTKGDRRYRYYVCSSAQKRGWHTCPSKSIPAQEIERFVVDQIRDIGKDPELIAETIREVHRETTAKTNELKREERLALRDLEKTGGEIRKLSGLLGSEMSATARLADLQERVQRGEERLTQIRGELQRLDQDLPDGEGVALALTSFDEVWEMLTPREQARILHLLVQRIDYDGDKGTVSVTFHPWGFGLVHGDAAESTA